MRQLSERLTARGHLRGGSDELAAGARHHEGVLGRSDRPAGEEGAGQAAMRLAVDGSEVRKPPASAGKAAGWRRIVTPCSVLATASPP